MGKEKNIVKNFFHEEKKVVAKEVKVKDVKKVEKKSSKKKFVHPQASALASLDRQIADLEAKKVIVKELAANERLVEVHGKTVVEVSLSDGTTYHK